VLCPFTDNEYKTAEIVDWREEVVQKVKKNCYYIHFQGFDKRLDKWVPEEDLLPLDYPNLADPF